MNHIDGAEQRDALDLRAEIVIVGSGPAGAAAAREAARLGADVLIVEAGPWLRAEDFEPSAFGAMASAYDQMGASIMLGRAMMPYVQGRMVGGGSPINGAICWRLPRDVYDRWTATDPALKDALPWQTIEDVTRSLEKEHDVEPTRATVAGPKNTLMAAGADALGLRHRPIRRNVRGCRGLGRCLQGCPGEHKLSVDRTLVHDAIAHGARVLSSTRVEAVVVEGGRARGVSGRTSAGGKVDIRARSAVVLAASAVGTPALLLRSGIRHGPVGENFQCHPGVSLAGRFAEPVRMWEGATQGHEVIGLRAEGLKFETLGFGPALLAARLPGVGAELAERVAELDHWLDWGVAVRATARGRVRVRAGRTLVTFTPSALDVARFRRGVRILGEMMFAAGADAVAPGIRGVPTMLDAPDYLQRLEREGPRHPGAFTAAVTHMFGTCRLGSVPERSVVGPDFEHHTVERLFVADSSVFPTNLGVNPQLPIMALGTLCGRSAAGERPRVEHRNVHTPGRVRRRSPSDAADMSLSDLLVMGTSELSRLVHSRPGPPLDALEGKMFLGVDLSLPRAVQKLLWQTFCKTFTRDPSTGKLRGWNVRVEQTGVDGPLIFARDERGRPRTFGHYVVRSSATRRPAFPGGWAGDVYLDYGNAGNHWADPSRFAVAPLVAVNVGSADLLLGWEVGRIGRVTVGLGSYWALVPYGPLDHRVEPPAYRATATTGAQRTDDAN